jgi:hypothetical protein
VICFRRRATYPSSQSVSAAILPSLELRQQDDDEQRHQEDP